MKAIRLCVRANNGYCSITQAGGLKGTISIPGDKSIAHRCIIAASISQGRVQLENFPASVDCFSTLRAFQKLGIRIKQKKLNQLIVSGKGLRGLKKPHGPIFLGDSGTSARLLLGVLAAQPFKATLRAGKSLSQRPMLRVTEPLRLMGAQIVARSPSPAAAQEEYLPIAIRGGRLKPITYQMRVASAQVKSAILLAGLYADGITAVIEPLKTRDHTERLLKLFKADIKIKGKSIFIKGSRELKAPKKVYIPGDISSASFFIALASIVPCSEITIKNVGLNPTRTGAIKVLKRMGANILVSGMRGAGSFEPMGEVVVRTSSLKGTRVKKEEIPSLIDELPILMVAACKAVGRTVFEGVGELRVKETDRIKSMSDNLKKMGANIRITKNRREECVIIKGVKVLRGTKVRSFGDHRTAMSMIVAGLSACGRTLIDDVACINKSFPGFLAQLRKLL